MPPAKKNKYVGCDYFFFCIIKIYPKPKIHKEEKFTAQLHPGTKKENNENCDSQ